MNTSIFLVENKCLEAVKARINGSLFNIKLNIQQNLRINIYHLI
jgi:hypothetical protein